MTATAAYVDVNLTQPSSRSLVVPRTAAQAELEALLDEIATWPDDTLVHMYKRYATSRLFRVRHDPQGPLTDRAVRLLDAARGEIESRGLSLPEIDAQEHALSTSGHLPVVRP